MAITYESKKYLKRGCKIWKDMAYDLWAHRELMWRFFIRDISAKYRQSFLGYVWAIVIPLIAVSTFMLLNKSGVLNIENTDVPYPIFALIGLSVWQLFATGINSGTRSIVSAGTMVSKINFQREVLVFSSISQALFEFLIKCGLMIILFFAFRFVPSKMIVLFPIVMLPIVFLTLGLSLLFALLNSFVRDIENFISIALMFLMFLTPVFYPLSADKGLIFLLNPISPIINATREVIVYGFIKDPVLYIAATIFSIFIFLFSWRIFYLVQVKIPERI